MADKTRKDAQPTASPRDPYAHVPKAQRLPPPTMQPVQGTARYLHTFTCVCSVLNLGVESDDELMRPPECPMCRKAMEPQAVIDRRSALP